MFIDLHTHGKLSKKSDFSITYFKEMLTEARSNDISGIALTEHFNTKKFLNGSMKHLMRYILIMGIITRLKGFVYFRGWRWILEKRDISF